MSEKSFNFLHPLEHRRDSYGFVLRPQQVQTYRQYLSIYKEEENERSHKWKSFLEQQENPDQCCSSDEENSEKLQTERTESKEETVSEKCHEACDPRRDVQHSMGSKDEVPISEEPNKEVQSSEEPKEKLHSSEEPQNEVQISRELKKEVQPSEKPRKEEHPSEELPIKEDRSRITKAGKVKKWSQVRPSLRAIENVMSSRVKNVKDLEEKQIMGRGDHLLSIKESLGRESEGGDNASTINSEISPEPSFPLIDELAFLVRGGVPKDLRGEVWQAFVGAKARRVKGYYEGLLAEETDADESNDQATAVLKKWKRQIEKDIPRTFPGHPALDEHGRDSLRRLLIAYAQHNPSVGYCQAMNYFAGLLLLLMPEENAFWTLVGIIDEYFEGYYTEDMIESQVDQLVFEELMRERFPKLVNHLDYLGVQVAWISGPWFLSIFVNMIPWESVLRVWDVILFEGNRVMLFRTALALMDLYGPALVTTKDAGDAITLLQSLSGSTFDSSQLAFTACMGFLGVTEARLQELRDKHRPSILQVIEEKARKGRAWKDSKGLASKLYSFKHDSVPLIEEQKTNEEEKSQKKHWAPNLDDLLDGLTADSEVDSLREQVVWLKVELCRLLEEKRNATLRSEELETALMEMVQQDNRRELSAKIEQLEEEVACLKQVLSDKKEQEAAMLQVLMRVEQEQRITEEARVRAEKDSAAQRCAVKMLQEKYDKATGLLAQMEKRVVMAESMLEATLQYESGQAKAQSPGAMRNQNTVESPRRRIGLMPFGLGWRDKNKGKPSEESSNAISDNEAKDQKEGSIQEQM